MLGAVLSPCGIHLSSGWACGASRSIVYQWSWASALENLVLLCVLAGRRGGVGCDSPSNMLIVKGVRVGCVVLV